MVRLLSGQGPSTHKHDVDGDAPTEPGRPVRRPSRGGRRRRIPLWARWGALVVVIGLVFRRGMAWAVLVALSAILHVVGINASLPHIKFAWPWQTITTGTTTNTDIGPWVLQKIEGISKPALGQANFNFMFTHKVSKNFGPLPCWYSSTFYAVGHASATVNLNPGPSWWAKNTGHYRLQILRAAKAGKPGLAAISMVLPKPQLPQSANDVTINNLPSKPVSVSHSWTYPGIACGLVIKPQFSPSVLYAQAQQIAYSKATSDPQITKPLITSAEKQATQTIRDNFVQPAVNAFGYTLDRFTLTWAATSK